MVVVSAGHVDSTRGSGIVSSTADVLWMSVVRGMRELVKCVRCVCLGAAWVEREVSGLGLGFTNPVITGGVLDAYLCCGGMWVGGLDQGLLPNMYLFIAYIANPDSFV